MFRRTPFLVFLILAAVSTGYAQRDYPGGPKKEPPPKSTVKPRPTKPRGSTRAAIRTNGVLFVLTSPDSALVKVKNQQGQPVEEGKVVDGQYRVELPPGSYKLEISADKFEPVTKTATVRQAQSGVVQVDLVPTTGSIVIGMGSIPADATILIDGKKPASITKQVNNQIQIDDVDVGSHTLQITHPSIVAYEEKVNVLGGESKFVTPVARQAIARLLIKSEPEAQIYVDGSPQGRVTEKGELTISNIKPGRHTIRAEKEGYTSEEKTQVVDVGEVSMVMKLNRREFSPEFTDYFAIAGNSDAWDTVRGWQVKHGELIVKGSGVGLVRDRIYKDFKLVFDISFVNSKGAVWIVRAQDKQNYYMFQLSGPNGTNPKTFSSYICQNGQIKPLKPAEIVVDDLSRPNDSYTITIEAKGSTIKHFIQVKSDPKPEGPQALSTLSNDTFSYGQVGFGTKDGEEFIVKFINVTPEQSTTADMR